MEAEGWLREFYEAMTDSGESSPQRLIQVAESFRRVYPSVTNRAGLLMALLYEVSTGISHASPGYMYLYNPIGVIMQRTREVVPDVTRMRGVCPNCGATDGIVGCAVSVPFGEVVVRCTQCLDQESDDE